MTKRCIRAAALGIALFAFSGRSPAAVITFTGVIDESQFSANHTPLFAVGDPFSATFYFNARPDPFGCWQGGIGAYSISLGDFTNSGVADSGGIVLCLDVSKSNLLYQVFDLYSYEVPAPYGFIIADVVVYDPALGGVIPPFEQLTERDFSIDFISPEPFSDFARGHLTSFPTIRNLVSDRGASLTLLSLGVLGLAMLRGYPTAGVKKGSAN